MREKNYNLELIRMISFIFVIAIHVTNYYCRAWGKIPQAEYVFSLAVNVVSRMSVPCFLMISGALLLGRDEPVKKHLHRTLHFLTALIVWDAVYYLWNTYYMRSEFDLREILYVPAEAHLWYLYAMVPIYLAMPFLQILCRNMNVRTERAFMAITSGAVLFTWLLRFMGAQPYYDLPIIGDKLSDEIQAEVPDPAADAGAGLCAEHGRNLRGDLGCDQCNGQTLRYAACIFHSICDPCGMRVLPLRDPSWKRKAAVCRTDPEDHRCVLQLFLRNLSDPSDLS